MMHDERNNLHISAIIQIGNAMVYLVSMIASLVFMITSAQYLHVIIGLFEMISCLLLIAIEANAIPEATVEHMKKDIGFLFVPEGRLIFIIMLGLVLIGTGVFGIIAAVLMLVWTIFSVFVHHSHPAMKHHDSGGGYRENPLPQNEDRYLPAEKEDRFDTLPESQIAHDL